MSQSPLYEQIEIDRINKIKETNDKMEEFFTSGRAKWESEIKPLFSSMNCDFNSLDNAKVIMEVQSTALAYRQNIAEQISFYLSKRTKEDVKIKKVKHDKFIWYSMNFGLKTNLSEKTLLMDAHTAEMERSSSIIENYIDFLRTSSKNLDSLGYAIKNIVELMNYLSKS